MQISDVIALTALIASFLGGAFALYQWRVSVSIKKAEFIERVSQGLRNNKEILSFIYLIDYDEFIYDADFHDSENELQMKTEMVLSTLDYLCYLLNRRLISKKEFKSNAYILHRVCENTEIQCYLWNLYHFSRRIENVPPYEYLINYCISNKVFVETFGSIDCKSFRGRDYLSIKHQK